MSVWLWFGSEQQQQQQAHGIGCHCVIVKATFTLAQTAREQHIRGLNYNWRCVCGFFSSSASQLCCYCFLRTFCFSTFDAAAAVAVVLLCVFLMFFCLLAPIFFLYLSMDVVVVSWCVCFAVFDWSARSSLHCALLDHQPKPAKRLLEIL